MLTSFIKSLLLLGTVAATASVSITALGQSTNPCQVPLSGLDEPEWNEIPTQLINMPRDPDDRNGPCSKCQVLTIKQAEGTDQDSATLELNYEDERPELRGELELTLLLATGEYHTITINEVVLSSGQHGSFEVSSGDDWTWDDVEHLWVEAIPAP